MSASIEIVISTRGRRVTVRLTARRRDTGPRSLALVIRPGRIRLYRAVPPELEESQPIGADPTSVFAMRCDTAARTAAIHAERWALAEATWGMLRTADVVTLDNPSGLLAIDWRGDVGYPEFQLITDPVHRWRLAPAWLELQELLAPARWSDEYILNWSAAPNAWLDGAAPAAVIQEHPEAVTPALAKAAEAAIPDESGYW